MSTRADLVASIHTALHSYTGTQEQITFLNGPIDEVESTIGVTSAEQAVRGIAEIDEELIYINAVSGNQLDLGPGLSGRGVRGSTAVPHAVHAQVTFDPPFPKVEIGRAINEAVSALYPSLYQVKVVQLDAQVIDLSYALPADCDEVLAVEVKFSGQPNDYWEPVKRWEFDPTAGARVLNLYTGGLPGTVRVRYRAPFGALTTTFAEAGIPDRYADLLLYAVTSRLIRFTANARVQLHSAENVSRAQVVTADDAGRLANQLYAVYQTRLAEERRRLLEAIPARPNFTAR